MEEVRGITQDGKLTIVMSGHIDSGNAAQVEEEITNLKKGYDDPSLIIDMQDLIYISSAGLRVILRLRKDHEDLKLINVSSEVYEILDMTGFNQMMTVEKAYRVVSVEGAEVIGKGANGTVYRIDGDNVVKVYNNTDALDDIQRERELARLALVLGVPTAISYDVVKVNNSYGSVFEMLNARSFSKILANEPEKLDWCVQEYVKLLKTIHGTAVPEGRLPDMRQIAIEWARFMQDHLPPEAGDKLLRLVEDVPKDDHMVHGDYHTGNLQLTGEEVLLIDMDTLAVGHPIFELASMYNAFVGFGEHDPEVIRSFMGFDPRIAGTFWRKSLAAYLETENEDRIREVEDKARIVGYTRMIRRSIRRGGLEDPRDSEEISLWKEELMTLLEKTDSLEFQAGEQKEMEKGKEKVSEIELDAIRENLPQVMAFLDENLEKTDCSMKEQMQIDLAVEEIFINIASYAYQPEIGSAKVRVEVTPEPVSVIVTFIDQGRPYDPLAKEDPDVTLSAEERGIGGLGIFMVKQSMDDVDYEYKDGRNILTLKKELKDG